MSRRPRRSGRKPLPPSGGALALAERDSLVAANPLAAIEDRGGWATRVAWLLQAFRDAKEAT